MDALERILSRPTAKPYRSDKIARDTTYLDDNGHVNFAPNDVENPKNWSKARRWYVTLVAVLLTVNATFASSAPSGCLPSISQHFGVSREVAGLTITLFLLGYCAGPLVFAPLSEFYGRRWVFYITFILYLVFNFLCAWAPNFGALLVGRFLTGTFVSAPLSNAPGVMADIWTPLERPNAIAAFSVCAFAGPALGPVIGGFLQLKKDWQWTFYILLWLGGFTVILMFTLPETLTTVVLWNKARRIRRAKIPGYENVKAPVEDTDRSLVGIFKIALTRPWIILFDLISFLVAVYLAVVYTLLYMLFSIYPIVFQERRGWNAGVGELPLIGSIIGAVLGGVVIVITTKRDKKRSEQGYQATPEDRLPVAMAAGVAFAASMFWFGWSAEYDSVHWIVPTLAGVLLSSAIMLIFVAFLNYLVDTYAEFAASAVAANTVVRSAAGASAPLFTNYMFQALGVGGGASLIGGVASILAIIPFAFYKYGAAIRRRSKFAPTPADGADEKKKEHPPEVERPGSREGRRNMATSSDTTPGSSSSTVTGNTNHDVGHRDGILSDGDQNEIGEPRDENTRFGREEV